MNTLKWIATPIDKCWSVVNLITDDTITVVGKAFPPDVAAQHLAMRLNIRDLADYASLGEFDWRGVTTGTYRHAIMPRVHAPFDNSLTLCDRPTKGMYGFDNPRGLCPECLAVIDTMNDGFKPIFDPKCLKWQQGKLDLAIMYLQWNNSDYADYLKVGV